MKKYFILSPEVAGQLGENTITENSNELTAIKQLDYQFDGWLGDDILECYPCFICTQRTKIKIEAEDLIGYKFEVCKISKSQTFLDLYPERQLPMFYWLKIVGKKGDDFFLTVNYSLVVSESVLRILETVNIKYCEIDEYNFTETNE